MKTRKSSTNINKPELKCIVCNASAAENPGRKFYPFLPLENKTPNSLVLPPSDQINSNANKHKYICGLHFQPKGLPAEMQCSICGATKKDFPNREFKPYNVYSENLNLNGLPVTITELSASSAFVCSLHSITKRKCCVPTCNTFDTNSTYKLFYFDARTWSWWYSLKIGDIPHGLICSRHFEKQFMIDSGRFSENAIPTLYMESSTNKYGPPENGFENDIIELDNESETPDVEAEELYPVEYMEDGYVEIDNEATEEPVGETPNLDSAERVKDYMQPLFDLALANEHYGAVDLLSQLEDIFKNQIKYGEN